MEHYRQRKYRGPETWARVREAYSAGESGPAVALRFDVGLANLRKKAMREGWTRNRIAVVIDAQLPPRREPAVRPPPAHDGPLRTVPVMEAMALAAARAAGLLAEGRAAEANTTIMAISKLARLSGMTADPAHQAILRNMLLELDPEPRA